LTRSAPAAIVVALALTTPAGAVGPPPCSGERAYPGDGATRPAFAAWMGATAATRKLPPELPVMAAIVESNVRNVPAGDADSVGFFQMRVGVWEGSYPGYETNPEQQLRWFLDRADAVLGGRAVPPPSEYGEWIADIERPEGQYEGRYQLRLSEARGLIRAGCAPDAR
jgi:hypothetical protein